MFPVSLGHIIGTPLELVVKSNAAIVKRSKEEKCEY